MSKEGRKPSGKRKGKLKWWWRHTWSITAASGVVLIVAQFIMYLLGYIDLWSFIRGSLVVLAITPLLYAVWYVRTRVLSIETQLKVNTILCIIVGVFSLGFVIFACSGFVLYQFFKIPMRTYSPYTLIPSYILGGYIGYRLGKRYAHAMVPPHLENEG